MACRVGPGGTSPPARTAAGDRPPRQGLGIRPCGGVGRRLARGEPRRGRRCVAPPLLRRHDPRPQDPGADAVQRRRTGRLAEEPLARPADGRRRTRRLPECGCAALRPPASAAASPGTSQCAAPRACLVAASHARPSRPPPASGNEGCRSWLRRAKERPRPAAPRHRRARAERPADAPPQRRPLGLVQPCQHAGRPAGQEFRLPARPALRESVGHRGLEPRALGAAVQGQRPVRLLGGGRSGSAIRGGRCVGKGRAPPPEREAWPFLGMIRGTALGDERPFRAHSAHRALAPVYAAVP